MGKIKKKEGPTQDQRFAFLARMREDMDVSRGDAIRTLAYEAGETSQSVERMFSDPHITNHKETPFSIWRLWNIVIFGQDVK